MKEVIKIGDMNFNDCGVIISQKRGIYDTLFDAYENPSITKRNVWRSWLNFFYNTPYFENVHYVDIMSRNTSRFTIIAGVTYKGLNYVIKIYPTHNDIYLLV